MSGSTDGNQGPNSDAGAWGDVSVPRHLAVYLTAHNRETIDHEGDLGEDHDGHLLSATVFRTPGEQSPMAPLKIRVAHGSSPAMIASMLRKAAQLIEDAPDMLASPPGRAFRRESDGSVRRRQVTVEGLKAAAEGVDESVRNQLESMLDHIRPAITDDEPGQEPGQD